MLDSTVVLQDIEALLDDHFAHLQAARQAQAEFDAQARHTPPPSPTPQPTAMGAIAPAANPVADFVTSVFMLFMFSVLEERLAR